MRKFTDPNKNNLIVHYHDNDRICEIMNEVMRIITPLEFDELFPRDLRNWQSLVTTFYADPFEVVLPLTVTFENRDIDNIPDEGLGELITELRDKCGLPT